MFKQTGLNSALLLSVLIIWTLESTTAVEFGDEKNLEFQNHIQRVKRQRNDNNFNMGFGVGFGGGGRRRGQARPRPGGSNMNNFRNELIFSGSQNQGQQRPQQPIRQPLINNNSNINNNNQSGQSVVINNRPTIATAAPFTGRTTASPQFISCVKRCPTTSEYNPICGSDQELYFNEQKFNCAQRCGADIQIVRRGSCQGLFPMMRG